MLPFAEEAKRLANVNGLLPWELAPDSKVADLLKPGYQLSSCQEEMDQQTSPNEPLMEGTDETYD